MFERWGGNFKGCGEEGDRKRVRESERDRDTGLPSIYSLPRWLHWPGLATAAGSQEYHVGFPIFHVKSGAQTLSHPLLHFSSRELDQKAGPWTGTHMGYCCSTQLYHSTHPKQVAFQP